MNKIGVLIGLRPETDVAAEFKKAKELGVTIITEEEFRNLKII